MACILYKKKDEDKINKLRTLTLNHFLAAILLAAEEVSDAVMHALAQLRVRLHALQQQPVEVAVALKRFDRCYKGKRKRVRYDVKSSMKFCVCMSCM